MNRLAVAALSGLLIAFVHAFAAPSAHAQCTFQNPVTNLNDGDGFLWDIQSNGTVVNGTGDSWDIGMGLFVDNVAYPFQGSLSTELSGRQVLVGPAAMSGLNVTRRVFVPTTDGWARWFDSFENTTAADITITVRYESNPGSDSGTVITNTSSGDTTFDTTDRWLVSDDFSNGSGDPTLNYNFFGAGGAQAPTSVGTTVFSCAGTQGRLWEYALTVNAGTTKSLMTLVGQNNNQTEADANALLLDALPTAALEGLTSAQVRQVRNWFTPKNVLFVTDSNTDENIPAVLTADGHTVTTVLDDYNGGLTTVLGTDLSPYDVVVWSATGDGYGSVNNNAAMMSNLENWVTAGGFLFVTGYDSVASPDDPTLANFVAQTTSIVDVPAAVGAVINVANSLTTGRIDIRGVTPTGGHGDRDQLNNLGAGVTGVAPTGTSTTQWQWTLRPLGGGKIAYVSNGAYDASSDDPHASWADTTAGGAGAYNAALRNFVSGASTTGNVTIANKPPVGVTGGPYAGNEGVAIALNGAGSGDTDGTVVQWEWDCADDGTYEIVSATGAASCTYPDNGVFVIRLRVTDDDGDINVVATTVSVNNLAPTAVSIGGATTGSEGVSLTVTGVGTDVAADPLTFTWNFGDGTTGTGASVNHTYADNGTYTLTLTVADGDGGTVTVTGSVVISNTAPSIDSVTLPATGSEGVAVTASATGSDIGADGLTFRWDFGDGTQIATGASVGHVYADQGTYTVTLTLTDDDGAVASTSTSISIANVDPTITFSNFPASGDEGSTLLFEAAATDVLADPLLYTWDFGDGTIVTGPSVTHVFIDQGTPTVVLVVTDGDNGSATVSQTVPIANIDPQIANVVIPASGGEGQTITMSANAVDAAGDAMTFVWDYGDGTSDTYALALGTNSSSTTHAYDDEGTYQITITVTDGDGGVDVFNQSTITINNLDPVVSSLTVPDGNEGEALSFSVVATDAPGDPLTYQWDFGDGTTAAGATATKTYTDDGAFTVTMTIQDDGEGGETIVTDVATISNVAPTVANLVAPATGDEGEILLFEIVSDDAGIDDLPDHVVTWDWGDGGSDTGASVSHAWIDQGTWTVTVTIDDQDGGTVTETASVVTSNVAPTITSTPPTNAIQGVLYSYQVLVTEPGDDVLTFSVAPSAPTGLTINSATGLIEFTATYAQSLTSPYTVVVSVTDSEGGTDGQVYNLNVLSADTDGDGIADDWETANGLDPNDSGDGNLDYDLDGLTNVQEFGLDQDPFSYDGPAAVTAVFPIAGEEVDSDRPDLTVDNAFDPNGDFLTYEFRVYADVGLSVPVTTVAGVPEDSVGPSLWKVDVPLSENTDYWWRARAHDGNVSGGWSATESFFVNTENEAPGAATLVWPIGGEPTGSLSPTLEWTIADDIDRDAVTYDVEVWDEAGETLVASMSGVSTSTGDINATWTVDVALDEDTVYSWMVLPVDEHGLEGEWTAPELFFSDGTDELPQGVAFLAPANGASLQTQTPILRASEGWDPEGTELTYEFEVDTAEAFDSADYDSAVVPASGTGVVVWNLAAAGVTLPENLWVFARVRAMDAGGVSSAPDTITFFIRGDNDAPPVPVLSAPEDGAALDDTTPELIVETPIDPDGDVAYVEFLVARDVGLEDVIASVDSVLATGDFTSWVVNLPVAGPVYWSARAFDADGASSDWADPWLYVAPELIDVGDDDDDSTTPDPDCACSSSFTGPGATPGLLLVLLLAPALMVRRRR